MLIFKKIKSYFLYLSYLLGSTTLLLVLGHFLIGTAITIKKINQQTSISGDSREILPVYDNYPNKVEFWKEHWSIKHSSHFEPYFHWKRDEHKGNYINISKDGIRETFSLPSSEDTKKIFMFGGSTMWGTGVKDIHTIPSQLQKLVGGDYKVYNYGETAYVSTQELNFLLLQLSKGNIPDKVVFYDGVNDGYAGAYSPAIPRNLTKLSHKSQNTNHNQLVKLYNKSNYRKLINYLFQTRGLNNWEKVISPNIETNTVSVLDLYEAHIRQVKALGKEYNFESYFFWQPNIFNGKREIFDYEKKIIKQYSPIFIKTYNNLYLQSKQRFSNKQQYNIFFLGDIFNKVNEPIYIDYCHLGPRGNELIANEIYRYIK